MDDDSKKNILIREILVAIDSSAHSRAALEAAAALARTMEAGIRGMYVREERWTHISRLPSVTFVNTYTGQVLSFEDETLEDRVKLLKNRLREQLKRVSRIHQVQHSWHFTSGNVEEKILEASEDTDLITIGLKGLSAKRTSPGTSAKKIILEADKPVLILKEGLRLGGNITTVYDGSEASRKGIMMALQIAERDESIVTLLDIRSEEEISDEQNDDLKDLFMNAPVFAELKRLRDSNASHFLNYVNQNRFGLLIMPKNQPILSRYLQLILNHVNCPLLLIA